MTSILYYPYINVPQTQWTLRTVLYYDRIASIVPVAYFHEPEKYDPDMLELVRKELVIPVNPRDALMHFVSLEDPFIQFLQEPKDKLKKYRKRFKEQLALIGELQETHGTRIHVGKFQQSVFGVLVDMNLAARQKKDDQWYWVEETTADMLMKYLAQLMSLHLHLLPVTDSLAKPLSIKKKEADTPYILRKYRKKRDAILMGLIPFPEEVSIERLPDFKEKHRVLLESFRTQVELIVLDDQLEEGTPLFAEQIRALQQRKEELVARFDESGWGPLTFGTASGIISSGITALTDEGGGWATGAAFAGLASAAAALWNSQNPEDVVDQSGMKYLALVDHSLRQR